MTPLQRSRFQAQATLHSHKISLVKITLHQVKVLHENKGESDSLSLDCAQPASVQIAPQHSWSENRAWNPLETVTYSSFSNEQESKFLHTEI